MEIGVSNTQPTGAKAGHGSGSQGWPAWHRGRSAQWRCRSSCPRPSLCLKYSSKVQQRGRSSAIHRVSRCFSHLLNALWRQPRSWFGTKRPQVQILSPRPMPQLS